MTLREASPIGGPPAGRRARRAEERSAAGPEAGPEAALPAGDHGRPRAPEPAASSPRRPLDASARPLRLHATVVVVGLVVLLAVVADLWSGGPLSRIDDAVQALDLRGRWPAGVAAATVLDQMGARWLVLPPLTLLAVVLARRRGTLRPVVEVVALALLTTAVVGVLKTTTGRARPVTGDGDLFAHDWPVGLIFPSGHTANVAMGVLGALLLLSGYSRVVVRVRWAVPAAVAPVALMSAVSLYLGWHWVSDLVAGAVVGAVAVSLVALASRPRRRAAEGDEREAPAGGAPVREGS